MLSKLFNQPVQIPELNHNSPLPSITTTSNQGFETASTSCTSSNLNDIDLFIGSKLADDKIYDLLTNYFEPDDQFKWSYKERKIN